MLIAEASWKRRSSKQQTKAKTHPQAPYICSGLLKSKTARWGHGSPQETSLEYKLVPYCLRNQLMAENRMASIAVRTLCRLKVSSQTAAMTAKLVLARIVGELTSLPWLGLVVIHPSRPDVRATLARNSIEPTSLINRFAAASQHQAYLNPETMPYLDLRRKHTNLVVIRA